MTQLIKLGTFGFKGKLSLSQYRQYLSWPTWNNIQHAIKYTRSYREGLEAGFLFLKFAEQHRNQLGKEAFQNDVIRFAGFILRMLDKLDMWEEYLEAWDKFRKIDFRPGHYSRDALSSPHHGEKIKPFIIGEKGNTVYVHFLYCTWRRKKLIQRKLEKKKAGKKIGNLFHGKQSDLSDQEINRRLKKLLANVQNLW